MKRREVTFRKTVLCVLGVMASICALVGFSLIAFFHPNSSDIFGAVIFSAFEYLFWLIGWHSAVRIDSSGVRVDNIFVRHYVPWVELADIAVGNGLEFRLRDGRKVSSLMYGGSITGLLLGYKYTRGVAARMRAVGEAMRSEAPQEGPSLTSYASRFYMAPWPPVVIVAMTELIAALALVTR